MKFLLTVPILAALLSTPLLAEEGEGVPILVIPEPEFDLGEIPQSPRVSHVFRFENHGDAPLVIHEAKGT